MDSLPCEIRVKNILLFQTTVLGVYVTANLESWEVEQNHGLFLLPDIEQENGAHLRLEEGVFES